MIKQLHIYDLDNTLFFTDTLNNESYNYALLMIGESIITTEKRITRQCVFEEKPWISSCNRIRLVEIKQKYFVANLNLVEANMNLISNFETGNDIINCIWTKSEDLRVNALLTHFELMSNFNKLYYSDKKDVISDIKNICSENDVEFNSTFVYEDDSIIISELAGLNLNLIKI